MASDAFARLGISFVFGHSFLGCDWWGYLLWRFHPVKVNRWVHSINPLAKAARKSPQVAFTAVVKSLQFEWSHVQKVVCNCGPILQQLHDAIVTKLYLILMFLSWRLLCFFYQLGWGNLAFVTQLNCVMLTLVLPLLEWLLFLLLLMVPLNLISLYTLLVSMLLWFLVVKVLTLGMKKGYTWYWISFLRLYGMLLNEL